MIVFAGMLKWQQLFVEGRHWQVAAIVLLELLTDKSSHRLKKNDVSKQGLPSQQWFNFLIVSSFQPFLPFGTTTIILTSLAGQKEPGQLNLIGCLVFINNRIVGKPAKRSNVSCLSSFVGLNV